MICDELNFLQAVASIMATSSGTIVYSGSGCQPECEVAGVVRFKLILPVIDRPLVTRTASCCQWSETARLGVRLVRIGPGFGGPFSVFRVCLAQTTSARGCPSSSTTLGSSKNVQLEAHSESGLAQITAQRSGETLVLLVA